MRVLYVNHTGRVSGGEHSLLTLLDSLPEEVRPAVACPPGELAQRLRQRQLEWLPIPEADGSLRLHPVRTPQALAGMARAAFRVRAAAAEFKPDVVHANSIRAGLLVALARSRPALAHVRDCLPPGPAAALSLRTIATLDGLIANSEYTRASLGRVGESARVVYNAVDLDRFAAALDREQARARLELPASGPVLAVIAQITPWKGQDDAIAVLAAIRDQHPDATLLLVGSVKFDAAATRFDNRAYLASLQAQAAALGVAPAVRFLGERDDVAEVLGAVDVLLAPSWEEPFGRSIVEAMAAGVAVAATEVGGPPEILREGETGLLLPPRSPAAWADAVGGLLADPARLERIGRDGREQARRRFSAERHTAQVLDIYAEAIAARADSSAA